MSCAMRSSALANLARAYLANRNLLDDGPAVTADPHLGKITLAALPGNWANGRLTYDS